MREEIAAAMLVAEGHTQIQRQQGADRLEGNRVEEIKEQQDLPYAAVAL